MKLDDIDYSNNTTAGANTNQEGIGGEGVGYPIFAHHQDGQFANVISVILGQLSKG